MKVGVRGAGVVGGTLCGGNGDSEVFTRGADSLTPHGRAMELQ